MELTYTVRGIEGPDYGPANLGQISDWIREGRILTQSEIRRSDMEHWANAGDFEELKPVLQPTPPALTPAAAPGVIAPPATAGDFATAARLKSGASWLYWIAALSMINSIVAFTGSD